MANFFLVVKPSCLKKRILKPKCAVTNVDWNNLTFEFLVKDKRKFARDDLKLLDFVRQEISEHFKACELFKIQ